MILKSAAEQTIINLSAKATAGGTAVTIGSGVAGKTIMATAQNPEIATNAIVWADIGVICGIIIGFTGAVSQILFSVRRDRREARLNKILLENHKARLENVSNHIGGTDGR